VRKPTPPEVKQWSRMSTIMKHIDHSTGEVETSYVPFKDSLVTRLETIFKDSTDEMVYHDTLTRTTRMSAGVDESVQLVSMYQEISKNTAPPAPERVRELRIAPEMRRHHSADISREDATIELTDTTSRQDVPVRDIEWFREEARRTMEMVREWRRSEGSQEDID